MKPVSKIDVSTPLTRKPPTGKNVVFIRFNLPVAAQLDPSMVEAAKAVGWNVKVDAIDAADPQALPNAMIRAVGNHADYIWVLAASESAMGPGLDAAKKAGIPVFMGAGVGEIGGKKNGIYGNTAALNSTAAPIGLLDKMIVDSKGTGSAVLVNAPDFPINAPIDAAAKKHIADNCKKCSLYNVSISPQDLGGDVASQTVAAIRQHPEVKYVVATFDGLVNGLPQALKAAGLNDVKVYIAFMTPPFVKALTKGEYAANLSGPDESRAWIAVDQMARHSVGMGLDPSDQPHYLTMQMELWTPKTVPEDVTWDPPNMQDQYKKLWQVQ
jgi:ABC-type sugar transport system substrate-binding protein